MTAASPSPVPRLAPIEGLRAYLALWVLFSHAMQWSGYLQSELTGPAGWVRMGFLPVKIFMIISGFVIFHRLETRRETAGVFLLHRFFRLYPLYLLLFLASVPLSADRLWATLPPAAQIGHLEPAYADWSANPLLHVLLHGLLLHGFPPEGLVPGAAYGFLPPAWSVALEFQFYLAAPLIFYLATRTTRGARTTLYGLSLLLLVIANRHLFALLNPLSLPFFWTYFLLGVVSLYAYRHWRGRIGWPLVAGVALGLFKVSDESTGLFPVCAWLVFFGLLLEEPDAPSARVLLPLFNHPAVQYLGRISYSIYLSHWPVLVLVQLALARLGWVNGGVSHLVVLFSLTLVLTLAASAVLYRTVEKPGIALGQRVAARLFPARSVTPLAKVAP